MKEKKEFREYLAIRLKQLRKTKRLTLRELSIETGISRIMLHYYESEKATPTLLCFKKLIDFYGQNGYMTMDDLLREFKFNLGERDEKTKI